MKKSICILLGIVMMLGILAGCAGSNEQTPAASAAADAPPAAQASGTQPQQEPELEGEITIMHYLGGEARNKLFNTLMDEFSEKYPKVDFESSGTDYANYMTLIRTKAAAGDMPDFFMATPIKVTDIVDSGKAMDLKAAGLLDTLPLEGDVYKECEFPDGGIYGMPMSLKLFAVYYNADIFQKYGIQVPKTNSEFLAVCQKLKDNGVDPFIRAYKDYTQLYADIKLGLVPALAENGHSDYYAQLMSGQKKFADYPEFISTIDDFRKRLEWSRIDDLANDTNKAAELFAQGKGAMYMGLLSVVSSCFTINPDFNMSCFPYPYTEDPSRHKYIIELDDVWMVSKDTKVKDAVFKWSQFLYEKENAQRWAEAGGLVMVEKGIDTTNMRPVLKDLIQANESGQTVQNCIPQPVGEFVNKYRSYLQAWVADVKTRTTDKLVQDGQHIYDEIIKSQNK